MRLSEAQSIFIAGHRGMVGGALVRAITAQHPQVKILTASRQELDLLSQAAVNTFIANTQSANAQGKYQLGTSPCLAGSCNLTTGAGANYRVVTGTLRLAQ